MRWKVNFLLKIGDGCDMIHEQHSDTGLEWNTRAIRWKSSVTRLAVDLSKVHIYPLFRCGSDHNRKERERVSRARYSAKESSKHCVMRKEQLFMKGL